MPFLATIPTRASASWDTQLSAVIPDVAKHLRNLHPMAMPLSRILWNHKVMKDIPNDDKVAWNFETEVINPHSMSKNQRFDLTDKEVASRMEWKAVDWYTACGTNIFEVQKTARTNQSLIDIVSEKVSAMHRGMTWAFHYLLFSNWSETIDNNEIDIGAALSGLQVPPDVKWQDITFHWQRINSLPMLARRPVTGYTQGNIPVTSTTNKFFHPNVTDSATATIVRNTTAYHASTNPQTDIVTSISGNYTALSVEDDLELFLSEKMQVGGGYNLYCMCSSGLYQTISSYLKSFVTAPPRDNVKLDLGTNGSITWDAYNTTFFVDPFMNALWPNALFFFDPDKTFLIFDSDFSPYINPWETIPGTDMRGTSAIWEGQLITTEPRSIGAMYGYKKG